MAADPKQQEALGNFIKGILSGTADIGISLMPLLGAYKKAKTDPEWREFGFQAWLTEDPNAAPLLERVFTQVRDTLPEQHRAMLILALGGTPE